MNIYIWEGVLCDYSCGIAVAIAETEEEAIALFESVHVRRELEAEEPVVIPADTRNTHSYFCWGGG